MSWMNIADEIRARITMDDVFERYGFEPGRGGFISCPFHTEKTASLSAYDEGRRWKCFGCEAGGSVIDFVMKLYELNFSQTLIRMDCDFNLNLLSTSTCRSGGIRERRRIAAEKAEKARKKASLMAQMNDLSSAHEFLWQARLQNRPESPEEPPTPLFIMSLKDLDWLEYKINELYQEWKKMG